MRFVDEVRISIASGAGGNGCVSFLREKFNPDGGPDGGSGGRGGALIIEATRARNTLVDFKWNKTYAAGNGSPGKGRQMTGAAGEDLVLYVPVGTSVSDYETGEQYADLDHEGATWRVPGGAGGAGNMAFKTSTNRAPTQAAEGKPATAYTLHLELKLLADVGLLGFPNAGKSTFVSRISAARPKIADYPFTTLVPQLGVVSLAPGVSFVVADIPGLIEGAAEGVGLGHAFLKHVERCGLYFHLVAPDDEEATAAERFLALNDELRAYDEELLRRPQLVVLSKADTLPPEELERQVKALSAVAKVPVMACSSVSGQGIEQVVNTAWKHLSRLRGEQATQPT